MSNTQLIITALRWLLIAFICIECYTAVSVLFDRKNRIAVMAKKTINLAIGKSNSVYFNPDRIISDLSKYGIMYSFRDYNMEASTFVSAKFTCAGMFALLGIMLTPDQLVTKLLVVAICLVCGFFAPDVFMRLSNQSDNAKMMSDIQLIYTTLMIHAKAGVYITDSLIECQRNVENGRLKQALNEMNNNILASRVTIEEAVDQFNARFRNDQIDNLAVIIKQALETGRSSDMLEDLSKQIDNYNRIRSLKTRDRIKRQAAFIQVTYFSLITFMLLYLVAVELMVGLSSF